MLHHQNWARSWGALVPQPASLQNTLPLRTYTLLAGCTRTWCMLLQLP
jgi:hypothetical protein